MQFYQNKIFVRILSYSVRMQEKVWTFFTQSDICLKFLEIWLLPEKSLWSLWIDLSTDVLLHVTVKYRNFETYTAWKVSKYGIFLVRIFPYFGWILENTDQKNSVFGHFSRGDTDGLQFYLKSAAPRHAP